MKWLWQIESVGRARNEVQTEWVVRQNEEGAFSMVREVLGQRMEDSWVWGV